MRIGTRAKSATGERDVTDVTGETDARQGMLPKRRVPGNAFRLACTVGTVTVATILGIGVLDIPGLAGLPGFPGFPGLTGRAEAAPITYTETVTGSGSLGGVAFTNALVTLTQTADTDDVVFTFDVYGVNDLTSLVTVAGVGSASFTGPTFTAVKQTGANSFAGLAQGTVASGGLSVLSPRNPFFNTYDIKSSTGLLSGTAVINARAISATTAGDFDLSAASSDATFQATLSVAPEPGSLALAALGALPLAGLVVRRRKG